MKDQSKTKQALIQEILSLRQRIAELDQSESDRKRVEEALGRSEELYRTFLESTMDMVLLKDDELRHIMVNKLLLDFMGKEENEIIGKTDAELLPQSIAEVCRQTDVESMASHRPYRPALGLNAALEEIEKNKGILYDDAVADTCLRLFREKGFQLEEA